MVIYVTSFHSGVARIWCEAGITTTTTTTVLRRFVRNYPGERIPVETFTHSPILIVIQPLSAYSIYY